MFINSVVDYGSTGKIVRDLANGLLQEGNEVLMVYGRHDAKDDNNTFNMSDTLGMYTHILMTRLLGRHGLHSKSATRKLIKKIEAFQPDVINIHNIHGYYCHVPMLMDYLKTTDIKIIWTLHDAWLISGSSAYFDFNGCKHWNEGCEICNSTQDYPEVLGFKRQKKNLDWKKHFIGTMPNIQFITPSIWLKELLATSYLAKYPCDVVYNGINLDVFKPTKNEFLEKQYEDKKVLLGVASIWERRKGLDDFIELSKLISDDYQIVLIGLSEKQISALPPTILGVSRTSDATELAAYYTLAHAFLNPTYEDNYPTTNIEAKACGTRVIAYDTGGNKEVDGIEIVQQGDISAMWKQIQTSVDTNVDPSQFSSERFSQEMLVYFKQQD